MGLLIPAELRPLYPFRQHHFELGGPRMHYVDEGQGPVVLLLHGNPTWSFYYRNLILGLRDRYRVIVPDHVGCGLSDKPQRYPYTLATHVDNLERLVEHLGVTDVTLGVHDWGGAIGFAWAARHPRLVSRFVVFNTAAFFGPVALRLRLSGWPIIGELAIRGLNGFARAALRMATAQPARFTPEVRRGYLFPYGNYHDRVAILRFVRDIPTSRRVPSHGIIEGLEGSLKQFAGRPMVIFWGTKDFCFHEGFMEGWTKRFPRAEVHRFEDAGHYVVEDAHERIVPPLLKFLDRPLEGMRPAIMSRTPSMP